MDTLKIGCELRDGLVEGCRLVGLVLEVLLLGQLGHAIFLGLILVVTSGNLSSAITGTLKCTVSGSLGIVVLES